MLRCRHGKTLPLLLSEQDIPQPFAKLSYFMLTRCRSHCKFFFLSTLCFCAHFLLLSYQKKQLAMVTKDSIQEAYAFFHQKWRIYSQSVNSRQKDDIEYAISDYARSMSPELYHELARGREGFLFTHTTFADDISSAVDDLEQRL